MKAITPADRHAARVRTILANAEPLLENVRQDLLKRIASAAERLSNDELERITMNGEQFTRAARVLLLAEAAPAIPTQWGTESTKQDVAFVKRMLRNRP